MISCLIRFSSPLGDKCENEDDAGVLESSSIYHLVDDLEMTIKMTSDSEAEESRNNSRLTRYYVINHYAI